MVRSAATLVAAMILPGFALAQEPQGTHTVVTGDTLWDLSQFYYDDPFEWRVIWNANRDVVEDPNWIYPDEMLRIPGLPGTAAGAAEPEEMPAEPQPPAEMPVEAPAATPPVIPMAGQRTVFYRDTTNGSTGIVRGAETAYYAVSADAVYSAPWVVRFDMEPEHDGVLVGFATTAQRGSTIRSYELVSVDMEVPARVGDMLQLFRITRSIEDIGQVATPTGVLTVSAIGNEGVVGRVLKEYARVQPGDFVRPLPTYEIQPGQYAQEIVGGSEAMVMGFAAPAELNALGRVAFLDLGSDDGVTIGDEFILYGSSLETHTEGTLQVVAVTETMASARILSLTDNVFSRGVVVRLAKKMR
jgi:hypothetical protein